MEVLIVGCGETGRRIARIHAERGHHVTGVVRSVESGAALHALGAGSLVADLDAGPALPAAERVYWLAPPPAVGDEETRLAACLPALPVPREFLYMSTTGVYGERAGDWTDEATPVAPASARGRRRLDGERRARFWAIQHGVRVAVVRAAAIWCHARLPLARLAAGTQALRPEDAPPVNRIHAADLARLCVTALDHGAEDATFDAADGQPGSHAEWLIAVAAAFALPPPRLLTAAEAAATLAAEAWVSQEGSKRIRAARVREVLGFSPRPARDWLADIARAGGD